MWAKIFFELGDPYFLLRFRAVEHFCDRFTVRIFQNEDRGQILWEILFAKVSAKIVIKIRGNLEKLAIFGGFGDFIEKSKMWAKVFFGLGY